ncbi:MAG TPA: hypothetical protein VK391_00555 [Allosphingosinicella sp.]|nr:hypothetical protein [Allosphingosinicella sp.]
MTHQSAAYHLRTPIEAGRQVAQLRHVLSLVEEIAGGPHRPGGGDEALDESARVTSAYSAGLPIVQRRFDALAVETAAWSAAAVEALLNAGDRRSKAAARRLGDELAKALTQLSELLRP